MRLRIDSLVVALLGVLMGALPLRAEVVYQNINADPLAPWEPIPNVTEIGDDVTLSGVARTVTSFSVPTFNSIDRPYTGTLTARFYDLDGVGNPGSELWSGSIPVIGAGGDQTFTWTVPNVVVPDSFIWTIQFATTLPSTEGDGIGPLLNDIPQIGASDDVAFANNRLPTDDEWVAFFYQSDPPQAGDPLANYQAVITAEVPEPGALGVLAVGAIGLLRRRR